MIIFSSTLQQQLVSITDNSYLNNIYKGIISKYFIINNYNWFYF